MDNNFLLVFILSFIFCLSSCDENRYPIDGEKLSGGYFCRVDGVAILMADNVFKPSIHGDIKTYSFNEDYIIVKQKPNKESYRYLLSEELMGYRTLLFKDSSKCTLPEYQFYTTFIITNKDLMKILFSKLSPNHNSEDIQNSLIIADSLIENKDEYKSIFENEINYWIVSHKEANNEEYMPMSKIYGPFDKQAYLRKREEIGVPQQLQLKE